MIDYLLTLRAPPPLDLVAPAEREMLLPVLNEDLEVALLKVFRLMVVLLLSIAVERLYELRSMRPCLTYPEAALLSNCDLFSNGFLNSVAVPCALRNDDVAVPCALRKPVDVPAAVRFSFIG